jgi:hypothetical protein
MTDIVESLLPCPFCGAAARTDLLPHSGGPGWVQCSECECDQYMCDTIEEAVAKWNRRAPAQSAPETLWCCHVRGPDDVYPAPDYRTALAWADVLNALNWRVDAHKYPKPPGYENPKSFDDCLVKATPAPWPYSIASHAAGLAAAIEGFSEKSALSSAQRARGE